VEVLAGQVPQSAVFAVADPVFHAGVLTLPELQGCDVVPAGGGVGEHDLETVAVEVGEPELRAGMGTFATTDDPRAGRPGAEVEQPVSSMISPLLRGGPSALTAEIQASAGTSSMASWIF